MNAVLATTRYLDITNRMENHLRHGRKAFAALTAIKEWAELRARTEANRHGENSEEAQAFAGAVKALDVLRELVPAW